MLAYNKPRVDNYIVLKYLIVFCLYKEVHKNIIYVILFSQNTPMLFLGFHLQIITLQSVLPINSEG
jgi:hypothetical protein